MKMNRKAIARGIGIGVLVLGFVAMVFGIRDEYTDVNVMTGEVRTSKRFCFVYQTPWVVRGNWLAESAARQGMATEAGWKPFWRVSERWIFYSRACSTTPLSCLAGRASPEALNLKTEEEIDAFVRKFAAAEESERKRMIYGSEEP